MKIVTAAEMREIDRATSERFGVPSLTLMENAGTAVAEFAMSEYPQAKRIGIICGKGNNGGDGFVAARKLHDEGKEVRVLLLSEPAELRGDAAEMFSKLPVKPIVVRSEEELQSSAALETYLVDLLIDAVLGTGFRPPVSSLYAVAIATLNKSSAPVVAVDIPSGTDADVSSEQSGTVARANAVVTFTAPRPAHVFSSLASGSTVIAPIGSPDEAIVSSLQLNLITPAEIAPLLGLRRVEANKGNFGHVLVIGGSLGKTGAAAMAGMAALRSGAGLSTVATAKSALSTVAGFHPELMTEPLAETEVGSISVRASQQNGFDEMVAGKTVLAIGPGISRHAKTAEFVRSVIKKFNQPTVLDADGLNAFEGRTTELNGSGTQIVITPHPGEMARLLGCTAADIQKDRINVARSFAREHKIVVVLKGHRTLVAEPSGEVWVNTTGNPGMATGGTGDILTGTIAGLIAQNPNRVLEAVIAAVHIHGLAGDIARESMGEHSMIATDLLKTLPEAFRRIRESAQQKLVRFDG